MHLSPMPNTISCSHITSIPCQWGEMRLLGLLKYYSSSTFNICEHQHLLRMSGPPICIEINPNAKLVIYHRPIPVLVHWQDVKAGLDRDIRLGVIQLVLIGTPVTWWFAPRNWGNPNKISNHSTYMKFARHHTQSSFYQTYSATPQLQNCI